MATEVAMWVGEALLLGLPAGLALGAAWLCGWRLRDLPWLMGARLPATLVLAAGMALGVGLLLASPHAGEFVPARVFAPDALFQAGLGELLRGAAWPGAVALGHLLPHGLQGWLVLLGGVTGALVLAGLWAQGRGLPAERGMAALLVLVLAGALGTHLLAHLGAWGVRRLNFWTFLLLLLAFQQWRWRRRWRWARLGLARPRPKPAPG